MKLITKIVGATLGLALAVGVSVGVANNNRKATALNADNVACAMTGDSSVTVKVASDSTGDDSQSGKKMNKGSSGTITVPASAGSTTLYYHAVAWNGEAQTISLSCTNATLSKSTQAITAHSDVSGTKTTYVIGDFASYAYSVDLTQTSNSNMVLTLTAASSKRFVIFYAYYSTGSASKLAAPVPQYSSSNNEITWADVDNASSYDLSVSGFPVVHNATSPFSTSSFPTPGGYTVSVTAIGDGVNYVDSDAGTVSFAKLNKAGTEAEPYDIANAKAAIDGNTNVSNIYVRGIVSQVDGFDDEHKSVTYWISDDGTTTDQFEVYSGKGLGGADFASAGDVEIGATVVVFGSIKKYNSTYEFNYNNQLNSYTSPAAKLAVKNLSTNASLAYHYTKTQNEAVTDTLNKTFTSVNSNSYTAWSGKTGTSGAVYAGNSAGPASGTIQLRATSPSGIIVTTSGGNASKITVSWHSDTASGRTLDIYGKNTAYSAAADLYNNSNQGTKLGSIVYGTSTELEIAGSYAYIGIRSNSGALYVSSIEIDWIEKPTFVYSNVYLGFNGQISKTLWNRLDIESHGILGFGVMLTEPSVLTHEGYASIEALYNATEDLVGSIDDTREERDGKYYIWDTDVKYFYNPVGENQPRESGDDYVWKLSKGVTGTDTGLTRNYTAVAFIRTTDDGLIFLQEVTKSAAGIADDEYTVELDATLEGSLSNLAGKLN